MWLDLVSIAESISYTDDCDAIIWAFDGSARFLVQAVYKTISFSGGLNLLSPLVSGILLFLPRFIHIFLWLLSNNKILTRDNLAKRKNVDDKTCLSCNEPESACHQLFDCVVAKVCWSHLANIFHIDLSIDFESVACWWFTNNRHKVMNCCSAALMWC